MVWFKLVKVTAGRVGRVLLSEAACRGMRRWSKAVGEAEERT
jgi:hypothetical protein